MKYNNMKLTSEQLKRIIAEEVNRVLSEAWAPSGAERGHNTFRQSSGEGGYGMNKEGGNIVIVGVKKSEPAEGDNKLITFNWVDDNWDQWAARRGKAPKVQPTGTIDCLMDMSKVLSDQRYVDNTLQACVNSENRPNFKFKSISSDATRDIYDLVK